MKSFLKALLEKYLMAFGFIVMLLFALAIASLALSPIILAFTLENAWYLLLYVIVGPIFSVIIDVIYG